MTEQDRVKEWMEGLGFEWSKPGEGWKPPNDTLDQWITSDMATFFYRAMLKAQRVEAYLK